MERNDLAGTKHGHIPVKDWQDSMKAQAKDKIPITR